jgi:serine/threonine protein kinase
MASARLMKRQGPLRESDAAYVFKQAGETCCQRMYGNVRSILDVVCPSLESLKAFYTFYPWFSVLHGLFQITIVANRILVRLHQFLRPQWINCNMQCVWSKCRSVTVFSTCTTTGAFLRVRFWHFHKISSIFWFILVSKRIIHRDLKPENVLLAGESWHCNAEKLCKTAMLLSTRARSVFTIGHHWTVSKRGTLALISEDFTTAQELGTKMHEVRLTNR